MAQEAISDDKLRNAAVDVAYEFKMFRLACRRYLSPAPPAFPPQSPSLGHNDSMAGMPLTFSAGTAPLSSKYMPYLDRHALLIHFRVLMDFFYKREDRDDVRAQHYIPEGQPLEDPKWYEGFRDKCNKLFAHLTYGRTEFRVRQDHHWREIPDRVKDLEGAINGFLRSLTPERRAWFGLTDGGAE